MLNIRERFNNMLHSWINYKTLWLNYLHRIEQHDTDLQTIHLANNLPSFSIPSSILNKVN